MPYPQESGALPDEAQSNAAQQILITTTPGLEGYRITKYIQVVSAETVLGTGLLSELVTWVADQFGAEGKTLERKTAAARQMSLQKLQEQAMAAGADAVVGTSFAYSTNSRSMVSVIVTGTAVNAEPIAR